MTIEIDERAIAVWAIDLVDGDLLAGLRGLHPNVFEFKYRIRWDDATEVTWHIAQVTDSLERTIGYARGFLTACADKADNKPEVIEILFEADETTEQKLTKMVKLGLVITGAANETMH